MGYAFNTMAWLEINGIIENTAQNIDTGARGITVVTFDADSCQVLVSIFM